MLEVTQDFTQPGLFRARSANPSQLAAVVQALTERLGQPGDRMSAHALHHDEQGQLSDPPYTEEFRVVGAAHASVVELPREWRPNFVWLDRYHLIVHGAPAERALPLLGLYVGSRGALELYLHAPSVTAAVGQHAQALTTVPSRQQSGFGQDSAARWNDPNVIGLCRVALRFDPQSPHELSVVATPTFAQATSQALTDTVQRTAGW